MGSTRVMSRTLAEFISPTNESPRAHKRPYNSRGDHACAAGVAAFSLSGAVSGISDAVASPSSRAPIQYHAGASGLPVRSMSQVMTNCVEQPNTEIANAYTV